MEERVIDGYSLAEVFRYFVVAIRRDRQQEMSTPEGGRTFPKMLLGEVLRFKRGMVPPGQPDCERFPVSEEKMIFEIVVDVGPAPHHDVQFISIACDRNELDNRPQYDALRVPQPVDRAVVLAAKVAAAAYNGPIVFKCTVVSSVVS